MSSGSGFLWVSSIIPAPHLTYNQQTALGHLEVLPGPSRNIYLMFFYTLMYQKQHNVEGDTVKDVTSVPACQYSILSFSLARCFTMEPEFALEWNCYKVLHILLRTHHDFISKIRGHSQSSLRPREWRAHCRCRELLPAFQLCAQNSALQNQRWLEMCTILRQSPSHIC